MNKKFSTKTLVLAAVLTALSVVLTRFFSVQLTSTMRIGIGPLPIIMSGIILGPIFGGMVGLVADLIGFLINPGGNFHLGFTLSSVLTGVLPGIVAMLVNKNNDKLNLTIILSVISVYLPVHLFLNTLWLKVLMHSGFWILFSERALKVAIESVVVGFILSPIMKKMMKLFYKS
ncbi:MAG: folate family ECF transporter S component [Ezakiella sp.]|nr:folate family ECF transporter S component [Ezakiella sp.]MDD7472296.1 folate family ECF transporter S component [Bacillota bacterium]MDY3923033.1 folate family ECF transporter S component [Ezakiella sp.]